MQHALDSRRVRIENFLCRAAEKDVAEDVRAELARLGAVLICGHIERCLEIIILERLSRRAHERVLSFIRSHFKRGANYDSEAIKQLLERFDLKWSDKFKIFIDSNPDVKGGVDSLYAVRNPIAHGGNANMGLKRVQELFVVSERLIAGVVESTR